MTLGELFTQGGWAMLPIYACSLIAVVVFVKKVIEIHSARLSRVDWLDEILSALDANKVDRARKLADGARHPAATVVEGMLATSKRRPDRVEAEAKRLGGLELQKLENGVSVLSLIAQIAPLLGLLGTVLGMVDLFIGLQGSGLKNVDAAMLSSGIWKALLTTAAGLAVAVPALAAYSYLTSRTDRFRLLLSDIVVRVVTALPMDLHRESPANRSGVTLVHDSGREGKEKLEAEEIGETADAV